MIIFMCRELITEASQLFKQMAEKACGWALCFLSEREWDSYQLPRPTCQHSLYPCVFNWNVLKYANCRIQDSIINKAKHLCIIFLKLSSYCAFALCIFAHLLSLILHSNLPATNLQRNLMVNNIFSVLNLI